MSEVPPGLVSELLRVFFLSEVGPPCPNRFPVQIAGYCRSSPARPRVRGKLEGCLHCTAAPERVLSIFPFCSCAASSWASGTPEARAGRTWWVKHLSGGEQALAEWTTDLWPRSLVSLCVPKWFGRSVGLVENCHQGSSKVLRFVTFFFVRPGRTWTLLGYKGEGVCSPSVPKSSGPLRCFGPTPKRYDTRDPGMAIARGCG